MGLAGWARDLLGRELGVKPQAGEGGTAGTQLGRRRTATPQQGEVPGAELEGRERELAGCALRDMLVLVARGPDAWVRTRLGEIGRDRARRTHAVVERARRAAAGRRRCCSARWSMDSILCLLLYVRAVYPLVYGIRTRTDNNTYKQPKAPSVVVPTTARARAACTTRTCACTHASSSSVPP